MVACLVERLNVLVGSDNVLEVLEDLQRRHHSDLLNLTLENEEAIVCEVDAMLLEKSHHLPTNVERDTIGGGEVWWRRMESKTAAHESSSRRARVRITGEEQGVRNKGE